MTSLTSLLSRARIQLRLPLTVLISPLWAIIRNGCASGHDGKVFVENRECTIASSVAKRRSDRSRKNGSSRPGGSKPLFTSGGAPSGGEETPAPRPVRLRRAKGHPPPRGPAPPAPGRGA